MFGFGKSTAQKKFVGAREKRLNARRQVYGEGGDIQSRREGGQQTSSVVPMTVVIGLACVLAALLSEGPMKSGNMFRVGDSYWDKVLGGPGYPSITGGADMDQILVILLRGLFIALVAGIVPLTTWIVAKLIDSTRTSVYMQTWGVIVALAGIVFAIREFV